MSKLNLKLSRGLLLLLLLPRLSLIAEAKAEAPLLVDLVVTGSVEAPNFDPQQLQFNVGQDYLLVMMNDKPYPVTFTFNKFGQSVATHLLQGAANVSQDSVVLFPATKVLWQFIPKIAGEFNFFAANSGYNQRGTMGKIVIIDPAKIKAEEEQTSADTKKARALPSKGKLMR